jgi:hypothetical protein
MKFKLKKPIEKTIKKAASMYHGLDMSEAPKYSPEKHGVTQSYIHKWRECPKSARLSLQGLYKPSDSAALNFGNVFHEALDIGYSWIRDKKIKKVEDIPFNSIYQAVILAFKTYFNEASIEGKQLYELSFGIMEAILPIYFDYWKDDLTEMNWYFLEDEFCVKHPTIGIPVRGKFDGVYIDKQEKYWLFETKTKGQWNEGNLALMIERDLQVNLYLWALEKTIKERARGVLYNIVRRPLLRRKASEKMSTFIERIKNDVLSRPEHYFSRLEITIPEKQTEKFKKSLEIELKKFKDWWYDDPSNDIEYTNACIGKYGACSYLNYCASFGENKEILSIRKDLFPELKEANK